MKAIIESMLFVSILAATAPMALAGDAIESRTLQFAKGASSATV